MTITRFRLEPTRILPATFTHDGYGSYGGRNQHDDNNQDDDNGCDRTVDRGLATRRLATGIEIAA